MDELLTVKTSDFEADLAIARSYLLDNNVDCVINTGYFSVSTVEGKAAQLQVRSDDYEKALDLLRQGGFLSEDQD